MIRVGVVRGGISPEYEISLMTGGNVISCLQNHQIYKPVDILIDKNGSWHLNGIPAPLAKIFNSVDVIFNALHGDYGEDGKISQLFEHWKIPYTGSGPFASSLAYNKVLTKKYFDSLGIKTPRHILFPVYQKDFDGPLNEYSKKKARQVWEQLPPPWIVKPLTGGSSFGIHACRTFPELVRAFDLGVNERVSVIVEELIEGREATVPVVEKFRDQRLYAFPCVESHPNKDSKFFDYNSKYINKFNKICPGNFTRKEKNELEDLAKIIHKNLNLNHYSATDFILHPKRGIYAIEVNTLPGLTDNSIIPLALSSVGSNMTEFISHIISLGKNR